MGTLRKANSQMKANWQYWNWKQWVAIFLSVGGAISAGNSAVAQITPDNTLGAEKSVVQPVNSLVDRIDGGAIRGVNLFHSFQEFNIGEGRGAYFANPTGITNIFSRVTGSDPSRLLGTLGVSGNANLFFLNPNGIIFGPNAKLDMGGSLVTSTANSVIFPNGMRFSASNPEAPPLLTINVSAPVGLEFESEQPGALVNAGNLAVGAGQNLTLAGGTVVSTGKLSAPSGELAVVTVPGIEADGGTPVVNLGQSGQFVNWEKQQPTSGSSQPATLGLTLSQLLTNGEGVTGLTVNSNGQVELTESNLPVVTGDVAVRELNAQTATLTANHNLTLVESLLGTSGNLNLLAKDTVRVRDSVANPFIAAAGGQLLLQGNQGVDIFALNHPDSGLFSGGDMVLRSADKVGGDAHYYAGGNFRIEKLDGSLGNLYSPHDPVIRSLGDVSFYAYEGASLHILAAGKVEIPGYVFITSPDTLADSINSTTTPELANVTLSDGTALEIDGNNYLTLDVRAGMKPEKVGIPEVTGSSGAFYDSFFNSTSPNVTASPTSGDIIMGDIFTNNISGDGGRVFLTNRYQPNLSLSGEINLGSIDTRDVFGGGSVVIDSRGGITIDGTINLSPLLYSSETVLGNGGNAILLAKEDITLAPNSSIKTNGLLGGNITLISKADVSLTNNVEVNVRGGGGGNIVVNSANLSMSGESKLRAGIALGFGSSSSQAGNIDINATGTINLTDGSLISNAVLPSAVGKSGNVNIITGSLSVTNGAQLTASTGGKGDAGSVTIHATEQVSFDGGIVASTVEQEAVGKGGAIDITARSLSATNGTQLLANTRGKGDAGNIIIRVTEQVSFDGTDSDGFSSGAFSAVEKSAVGNGGNVNISTGLLSVTNGAQLAASTLGHGNAGSIIISATEQVSFDGTDSDGFSSGAFSTVEKSAVGNGGNVDISTGLLSVTNSAQLAASTLGHGNAGSVIIHATEQVSFDSAYAFSSVEKTGVGKGGNVDITTGSLFVNNRAQLAASTLGQGNAGSVTIHTTDQVFFDWGSALSMVERGAVGKGGNVNISTGSLSVTNGAQLAASTLGHGNAGNITIYAADQVFFDGVSNDELFSGAFSVVAEEAVGMGGNVDITTRSLSVTNGSQLQVLTRGQGNAGNITIYAEDQVFFDGVSSDGLSNGAFSTVEQGAVGNGGNIYITTGSLSVTNSGQLQVLTRGQGNAGNVTIYAKDQVSFDGVGSNEYLSAVGSRVEQGAVGNGGNIYITTGSLSVTNSARLSASTLGQGDAGSVTIHATDQITFNGGDAFSSVETGAVGKGGNIDITTGSLSVTNSAQLTVGTLGQGDAGSVNIRATDQISFDGFSSGVLSRVEKGATGRGGNINITTDSLSVTNGAQLTVSTLGQGDAGSVNIRATDQISFDGVSIDGFSSAVFSRVGKGAAGRGGNINITTNSLSVTNGALLSASTSGQGDAGSILVKVADDFRISGFTPQGYSSGLFSTTESTANGMGGVIAIEAATLQIKHGGVISARSLSALNSGSISVNTNTLELTGGSEILTTAYSSGNAGNINVNVKDRITISGSDPTYYNRLAQFGRDTVDPNSAASGIFANTDINSTGDGGSIFIDPIQFTITDGGGIGVNSQGQGNGGNIQIQAGSVTLDRNAFLSAVTANGEGGNINLQVQGPSIDVPMLLMRHNSSISATAGNTGNGGNLNINAPFIIAVPGENSDITANAFQGRGGNIQISTQAIFGLEYRPSLTPLSDITASSDFGIDGAVVINTPGIDPSRGLTSLPDVPVNTQIVVGCQAGGSQASVGLFNVGRTGLPASPDDPLNEETIIADWINPDFEAGNSSPGTTTTNLTKSVTNSGAAAMTTQVPTVTPPCHAY